MIRYSGAATLVFLVAAGGALGLQPERAIKSSEAPQWLHLPSVAVSEIFQDSTAHWTFPIENRSATAVSIMAITSSLPGARGSADPATIEPGASSLLRFEAPVHDSLGWRAFTFAVRSSDADHPKANIILNAFVESAYVPERPTIEFGNVRRGKTNEQTIELRSMETDSLALVDIIDKPDWLSLDVVTGDGDDPQGLRLRATLKSDAPAGAIDRAVLLRTSVALQPRVSLQISANVFEDVIAEPFPLRVGAVNQKADVVRELKLSADDGKALQIAKVSAADRRMHFSHEPCGVGCVVLRMRLDTKERQKLQGDITVTFRNRPHALVIPYEGSVVSEGARIIDLGKLGSSTDITVDGRMNDKP